MILRAKYIIASPDTVIENGIVNVQGHMIKSVGHSTTSRSACDLGNAIITPGLINPHTHLEGPELYGGIKPLDAPKLRPPQKFTEWAQKVIRTRKSLSLKYMNKTVAHGYQVCIQNGITAIGDHTHLMRVAKAQEKSSLRRIVFEEIFNLDPVTAGVTFNDVRMTCKLLHINKLLAVGFAPHSPYSVSGQLYQKLFALAKTYNCILSTHLSEHEEEVEFTLTGNGRMVRYLKKIARYYDTWSPPYCTPVEYMHRLGVLKPPAFFVHCNYLTQNDIKLLAQSGASVVYCPNSHRYFGHKNHPLLRLLKAGVNVALGTDGLGSNFDLHILKEMKFVAENYTGLNPAQIFRMGTINAARTLRLHHKIGVLKPGFEADIAVFPINGQVRTKDVIPYLINSTPKSVMTMVAGKVVGKV